MLLDANVRPGNTDRPDRTAIGADDGRRHARALRLVLTIIDRVAATLRQTDLLPELLQVADRPLGSRHEIHAPELGLALSLRQRRKYRLAQGSRMERHFLPDSRDKLETVFGLELVDVVDRLAFHDPEMRRLADAVPKRDEMWPGDTLQVEADRDPLGKPKDLASQPVPPGDWILSDIARLDERPEQASDRRLVEANLFGDRRRPEPQLTRGCELLEDVQATVEGASGQFLTPVV